MERSGSKTIFRKLKAEDIPMKKYRIMRSCKGFSIWVLKDFGGGRAWVDLGRRFKSASDAEKAIADMEVAAKDEG